MDVHPEFYNPYLEKIPSENVVHSLKENMNACLSIFETMSEEKSGYRYAEGKWSLRELLGHIIDSERVFTYRALSFARGEQQELPGFDENQYVNNSNAGSRSIRGLAAEFKSVRSATIQLFESFDEEQFAAIGTMSGNRTSVHSLARIIAGHCKHHLGVIEERYF